VVYLCIRQAAAEDRKALRTQPAQEVASFDHVNA